jgi:hypothetical protein
MKTTMKATKLASLFGCLLLTVLSIGQLRAVPNTMITGSASFFGTTTASGPSGGGSTTIFFNPGWVFLSNGTGTYAGLPQTSATFTPSFSFTGDGNGVVLSSPVTNFWTFTVAGTTYSFNLSGLTNGHVQSDSMAFSGGGTLFATGATTYDPTPATFSMNGTGTNFSFELSFVTNTATSAPDTGSTLLLMSFGLTGLFACRRRLARKTLTG